MGTIRALILALPFALAMTPGAQAQFTESHEFLLTQESNFQNGCIGPSLCDCPGVVVGGIGGSMVLTPLLPPLGPVYEFAVEAFWWVFPNGGSAYPVSGEGIYRFDSSNGTQEMQLFLEILGSTDEYLSMGFVPASPFPDTLEIEIFHQVDDCFYEGFSLRGIRGGNFRRADCNVDGTFNLADVLFLLNSLFVSGPLPPCEDACDADDDGLITIVDAVYCLMALFAGGDLPPAPFTECGVDPSPDVLGCVDFPSCP